jgi:mannose-6-phosphate isomerase-like protein (cupin superfamily)
MAPLLLVTALAQGGAEAQTRVAAGPPPSGTSSSEATFIAAAKVAACAKASTLLTAADYTVICYSRTVPGQAEAHAGHTHLWYILEGEGTVVMGGTIMDVETALPGEPRGPRIEGGLPQRVVAGDVLVIPAGVPHQYTEVRAPLA